MALALLIALVPAVRYFRAVEPDVSEVRFQIPVHEMPNPLHTSISPDGRIKGSHSPHYDAEPGRRPLYQKLIGAGEMKPGYACDNDAGIYFEDNVVTRVVSARAGAKVYYVSRVNGQAVERVMEPDLMLRP